MTHIRFLGLVLTTKLMPVYNGLVEMKVLFREGSVLSCTCHVRTSANSPLSLSMSAISQT